MLLIEVQQYNRNCKQKTGCQCLSIVSSGAEQRLSVASTAISRQYVQCRRRRKKSSDKLVGHQQNCSVRFRNCKLLTDKMSFYLENDEKEKQQQQYQAKDQARLKDRTFFLSSINQSFSIFFNYLLNYKTPSTSAASKLIDYKFRFKFKSFQAIFLIILSCLNCVIANEPHFAADTVDSSDSISSLDTVSPINSFNAIPFHSTNLSSSNSTSTINRNSSTTSPYLKSYSSSLDFITNLLPSTKSFNYFYSSLPDHPNDQSTTRLPKLNNSFPLNSRSLIDHNHKNQTKSAHSKPINSNNNAFQLKFNQLNAASDNKLELSKKWPYDVDKYNWTDRFKKAMPTNRDWSLSASTGSAKQIVNHYIKSAKLFTNTNPDSHSPVSIDYDDSIFLSKPIPTPSALVSNQSNQTLLSTNDTTKVQSNFKDATNRTMQNGNFIGNLNITDSTSFMDDFLQPFTNISWWFKIPFPKSGYRNYSIVFLAIFITIVMMIVVIGNLLVCIAICTEKSLKTIQNWFIASLAISDLLLGLIIMPFSLAYELMGTWVFSDLWCDFHHALDVLLTTASINNLCLISLDRYWSVTQAIEYLKKRTPCRAIFMIVFAWVFSACVCLPPLIGWKKDNQEPGECQLSNDLGYVLYSSLGSFYIPSIVMIFVYAKIFVAARSRARKHVRKKQVSGGSSVLEQKKTSSQIAKQTAQQPAASTSSQDNATAFNKPVTTSASSIANQQQGEDKKKDSSKEDLQKSESKGSIKTQTNRVAYGRFTRRAQLGINNDQELEESSETDANQQANQQPIQDQQQDTVNLHTISNQTTNTTESSSGIGTGEEHQINSVPTSGSSVQTEPADLLKSSDAKSSNFVCARSTSAFTYDHLFVEDRKSAPVGIGEKSNESVGRPTTPSSKVTFSPNDIVFDLNANGTQSMVPQIVIHGSMQQLHLQTNVKRARFSVNKMKDSDFNNNSSQIGEKRFGHPTITGTLSAGQLDCVILDQRNELKEISTATPIVSSSSSVQAKRSSIKRSKYQNELEIDTTAAQQLNQQQTVGSPHSILKPSSNSSPTALAKSTNLEQQIELQEKSLTDVQHQPLKQIESNLSATSSIVQQKDTSNHVSPVSKTFSEQTANSVRTTQDGKLNYLGVSSLQSAASISGSMMSINYDYDSECYIDEKGSRRGLEDDEFEFDDENESSNTHDENASKRSVKSNLRQSKKGNFFTRWSWCKKWLWLNEKCASNQEEEFAGYEEDDEEEDEEFDELGRSSLRSVGDHQSSKKGTGKRILRKNRSKGYNASIISANNTSSSGTHGSGTAQQSSAERGGKSSEKKSSFFSRFSRDNSNKSTSSGSAKRNGSSGKQRSSGKSSCSVAAISQSSQSGRQRKHRHKSGSQLHAHSSSTAPSESGAVGQYRFQASDADRQKRRIAKAREKRATLILGLIMGAFILGYIPFSSMYLIQGICPNCQIQSALTITYWIGYTASAINPIIYTVFNRDFRKAFRKILFR